MEEDDAAKLRKIPSPMCFIPTKNSFIPSKISKKRAEKY